MRIIAFGDIHMELGRFREIPGLAQADLVIITGDFTNYGGKKETKKILDEVLRVNEKILALPGNLDDSEVGDYLAKLGKSLHGTGRKYKEIGIFGVGGSNLTPFNTPTEFSEKTLTKLLHQGLARVKEAKELILVSHAPPVDTAVDLIASGAHVGSPAVRQFIEEIRPTLCLTGHIHEARGTDRINNTLILNPGMIKDHGWIEVTIEHGKISAELNN